MEEYITIALPKGKLFKRSRDLLARVGYSAEGVSEDSRRLVITNEETRVRFIITKTVDLPTYIEYGAADIGIIGKDVLLEEQKESYTKYETTFSPYSRAAFYSFDVTTGKVEKIHEQMDIVFYEKN